jgi:hypothetical protein
MASFMSSVHFVAAMAFFRIRAGNPELIVAGLSLVGMAFDFEENLMVTSLVADSGSLYRVRLGIMGKPASLKLMISAEIIAIGSELLTPGFVDTNSVFLTRQLNETGIPVVMKSIVGR